MCLKQKDWSKRRGGYSYLNQVPWSPQQTISDHRLYLSIQLQKFLSRTHSRFFYMSLCAWVWVCVCVRVLMRQCVTVCLSMWVSVFIRGRYVGKVCICSAEEYLELYGNEEAVIRNCLLRWSEYLVKVAGTTPFSISLFALNILAFCAPIRACFRWFINA